MKVNQYLADFGDDGPKHVKSVVELLPPTSLRH